jgi:hypothetical protein
MRKVAQRCSTSAGCRRSAAGKSVISGKSAASGKSATSGASCAASGANPCHQWHNNYQGNNHRKTGAGDGEELKVIPFAAPAPENVVPLTAAPAAGVSFCTAGGGRHLEAGVLYASEAELLAKVVPCRVAEAAPPHVVSAQDAGRIWLQEVIGAPWYDPHKEALVAMALDTRRQCRNVFLISLGSLNETLASPREVFRPLIVAAAHTFILCHNHPSGNPEPSPEDQALAKRIQEAGRLVEIPLLDFVIFGHPQKEGISYYSFSENQQL